MSPPSVPGRLCAALLLGALSCQHASAELPPANSPAVAITSMSIPGPAAAGGTVTSLRSLPLVPIVETAGYADRFGPKSITDLQATWADGAYDSQSGQPRFYVELARPPGFTGTVPGEGVTLDILTSTGAAPATGNPRTLTFAQSIPSALPTSRNVLFKIRRHWTLATVFGTAVEHGLTPGTATTGDLVQLFNPATQAYDSYYYGTAANAGWRDATTGALMGHRVIYPQSGIVIQRRNVGGASVTKLGYVRPGLSAYPIAVGTNVVAAGALFGSKLSASRLVESGFAAEVNGVGDEVRLHNGAAYVAYRYRTAGPAGWYNVQSGQLEDPDLASGTAVQIVRGGTKGFEWKLPVELPVL